jgi:predicted cupin superfamily sugar epimerase
MALLPKKSGDLVQVMNLIPHPEGGFFLESFRSGSVPMTSRGQTNFDVETPTDLVETGRTTQRPDGDGRRNPLTSIYWVPTVESPLLKLIVQESDHVMLYHGGRPFEYTLYDPKSKELEVKVLGPDVRKGHHLQIPIKAHVWACGRLLEHEGLNDWDYCILGECGIYDIGRAIIFSGTNASFLNQLKSLDQDLKSTTFLG